MSNPICSLEQKISANNSALQRGQNLVPLQIGDAIHGWPFIYAGNKLYLHKRENPY